METVPIFPLNTVVYPGGPLPLRIFEPRYLDMVSDCMRHSKCFGVCLIRSGVEAGGQAETFELGTLTRIVDWNQLSDGLLGVTGLGQSRFRLQSSHYNPDNLCIGEIEQLPDERDQPIPARHQELTRLLGQIIESSGPHFTHTAPDLNSASWVGYRLCEVLPLPPTTKQSYLELEDPITRLDQLQKIIADLQENRR